jgi:hypothetical protein
MKHKESIVYQCGGLLAPFGIDLGHYQEPRYEPGEDGDFAVIYYLKEDDHAGIRIFGQSNPETGYVYFYRLEFI